MSNSRLQILLDSWIPMDWADYLSHLEEPGIERTKSYYYRGHGRFEKLSDGFKHGLDLVTVACAINLMCAMRAIPLCIVNKTTFRQSELNDFQPDLSILLEDKVRAIPDETEIVDLDKYPMPDLVVEISKTSLLDDLGLKRSLYEELGVSEYWIVDVKKNRVLAFEMIEKGSQRTEVSKVLPDFNIATLEAALKLSRKTDQARTGAWLMQQFQQS